MPEKQSLERTLLAEQLNFYRLQRHDFLNHWQVIMGYLQLGKVDRALSYMREGLNELEAEQIVGQIPHEMVSAILLGFVISLRKEEVKVEVELTDRIKDANYWKEFGLEEYGQALYGYTNKCLTYLLKQKKGLENPRVWIQLQEAKGFSCQLSLYDTQNLIWEEQFNLHP